MTVTIPYHDRCSSEQQATQLPRTPYPYDGTQDDNGSSPEASVVSLSSGEESLDDCYYHLPEDLALSPEIEKCESPETLNGTDPSTPSEDLQRLAESPEPDAKIGHHDTSVDDVTFSKAEAVHLSAGKCQTLINVSNPHESGNLCFECLTSSSVPNRARRSSLDVENRKLITIGSCCNLLLTFLAVE